MFTIHMVYLGIGIILGMVILSVVLVWLDEKGGGL